jgi:hypothetical protein
MGFILAQTRHVIGTDTPNLTKNDFIGWNGLFISLQ